MLSKILCAGGVVLTASLFLLSACGGASPAADTAIDYSLAQSWDAMPGIQSPAVLTPVGSGLSNLESSAKVDVFYIHPTTYTGHDFVNVPIDEPNSSETLAWVLKAQATPFNAIGRIFAPRYRQIALYVYDGSEDDLQAPLDFAFEDVRQAFRYYLDKLNHGRPFIIAGHSQGTNHAHRLLLEEVIGKPWADRFVAAWIPGMPIPRAMLDSSAGGGLAACSAPRQIACTAIWQTFGEGFTQFADWLRAQVYWNPDRRRWLVPTVDQLLFSVNPLTWDESAEIAPASLNVGAVPFGIAETNFQGIYPSLVAAQNRQGYLIASPDLPAKLFRVGLMGDPLNYHIYDFNLFWMNVRNNARERVHAFLQERLRVQYPLIESSNMTDAALGRAYSYQITTINQAQSYSAEGLPAGLDINTQTGLIAGAPLRRGTFAVVLKATNAFGTDVAELSMRVAGAP